MPNYGVVKRTFSKKLGKWITKNEKKAFDYERVNGESAAFVISFFRYYPDLLADLMRSENARYKLELPQRIMMRLLARYRNVFITSCRGMTKTFWFYLVAR